MGPPLGLPQRNISRWESVASVASQSGAAKKAGGAGAVIFILVMIRFFVYHLTAASKSNSGSYYPYNH